MWRNDVAKAKYIKYLILRSLLILNNKTLNMSSASKSKTNKVYVTNLSTMQQSVLQTNCSSHSKIIKDIGVSQNSCSNTYLANQKSQLQNHKVGFSTANKLAGLVLLLKIWLLIFQVKIASGATCQRAKFPKILGGTQDDTIFQALDYYEYSLTESRLVATGYSNDSVLLGGFVASTCAPIIQMYEANTSENNFNPIWQKSFAFNDFQFRAVAFNTDGNKVAVLTTHYYDSIKNIIILTVISGYPELQLKYNGSYTEYYQYMGRNMIMGSSWIHFQSYSYSYYQIVNIPIPFITANVWKRQSNSQGRPLGLIFGDSNVDIFAYSWSSKKHFITNYAASSGLIKWIYGFDDTSNYYPQSACIDYKRINTTVSGIIAASGPIDIYQLYSKFVLDSNGQIIDSKVYKVKQRSSLDDLKALQIIDLEQVRSLVSYYVTELYMVQISFSEQTVVYRKVTTYLYYGYAISYGKFSANKIEKCEAYAAISTNQFFKGNGTYINLQKYSGLIFNTNPEDSCGATGTSGDYVYSLTLATDQYPITDLASLNLLNSITTVSFIQDTSSLTIHDITPSQSVNIDDQCLYKPYELVTFPQTIVEFNTPITCTPQTISPSKTTINNICDTTATFPTITYDTDSSLPSSIIVNYSSGDIVINPTPVGKYTITIINQLYNLGQSTSQTIIINVLNNPPAFSTALTTGIKVALNSISQISLPSIIDPEGDDVTMTQVEYGKNALPSFVSFSSDVYTFNPTQFSEVGVHKIQITLSDNKSCSNITSFTVEVTNTAPYFASSLTNQTIHIGAKSQYTLPSAVDDEGNAITITDGYNLSYASIVGGSITFTPSTSYHLGISICKLVLSDSQKSNYYYLYVTVINDPPQFATALTPSTVAIPLNQNLKYDLPQATDSENHAITITTRRQGYSTLPSFIKFTQSGQTGWLDIAPTAITSVGTYTIEVSVADPYTTTKYSFSLEVTNTAPYFTSSLKDQEIHIDLTSTYALPSAVDDEGNSITISKTASVLPTYATVNGFVITFMPNALSHLGKVQCSIMITDSQMSNSFSFQVTVINDPPYFASTPNPSVKTPLNSNLKYDLPQALDVENHSLIIKAIQTGSTTLPSFIKLTQQGSTSWLDIAPTSITQLGIHSIQVSVADPYSETKYSLQVEVTNSAPYFKSSLQDQEIHIGLTSTYSISSSVADDEGNSISISPTTSVLPTYATVNGLILTFSPNSLSHIGKVQCFIDITDSLLTTKSTFYVTVINEAPHFLSSLTPIITVPLNKIQQYNLPTASDFENHAITITPSIAGNPNLPAFIKFTQTGSSGQFEFNPTALSDEGTYTIEVSLADPYDSTKYSFSVEVTNTAPYFTSSLVDQEIHIDITSSYTLPQAVDDQGNSISISLTTSVLPSYASVDGLIITFTPNAQSYLGKVQCSIDLTDSSKFTTYTFYVSVINEPPQFALSLAKTISVPLNKLEHYTLPQATDFENHVLTISPSIAGLSSLPSFIQFSQSGSTGQFDINPTAFSDVGSYQIDISLSDPYDSSKYSFTVEVTNTAPYFTQSLVDQEIHIDLTSTYTLPQAVDDEGNPITISTATSILPSFATVNGFIITFMPISPLPLGKVQCFIDLTDSQKISTSSFYVTVINDSPIFIEPLNATISVDLNKIAQYNLPATSDFENHTLTITPSITGQPSLPSFITFTSSSSSFTFQPTAFTDVGNHTIDVSLADPYDSTKYKFNLEVKNSPPDFDYPPEDVDVYLDILATISLPSFHDPEGNAVKVLTVEAGKPKLPSFIQFSQSMNEYLVLTYDSYNIGVTTIEVILSDSQLQSPSYLFDINVKPRVVKEEQAKQLSKVMNAGPPKFIIWNDNEKIYLTADKAFEYTLPKAEDPDNDEIIVNVLAGEAFGFIEYKNGVLLFNPKPSHVKQNPYTIKIVLEDQNPYFTKKSDEYKMQVFVEAAPVAASDEKEQQQQQQQQYQYVQVQQEKKEKNTAKFMQQVQQNEAEAAIRAQSISRDGLLKLKCINMQYNDILLKINQENIKIYLVSRLNIKEVNFTIVSIQKNFLEIQLYFDNPQTISSGSESDQIQLYFINPISNDKGDARILSTASINQMVLIRKGFVIKLKVPPQNIPGSIKTFTVIKKAIGVSSYIEFSDSVASNKFLSLFLLFMWSLLRDMSQLTMMSLLPLNIPGNVQSIVSIILNFVYLDIFFSNDWFLTWFDFDPENDRPISPQFDDVGLFSMNLVANLGTGLLLLIAQALILAIQLLISIFAKIMPICKKSSEYLDRKLKWNFYLRLFYYQFQPLFIASLINLQSLRYTTKIELTSSVISLLFIPISLLVIFLVAKQLKKLDKSEQSEQISCLINGISERTRYSYFNWNLIMLIRQIVIIIVLVMLRDYVVLQIQLLLLVALFVQIIVAHTKPFTSTTDNLVLFLNEFLISVYLYLVIALLYLSDPPLSADDQLNEEIALEYLNTKQMAAWALLATILLTISINLTVFFQQLFKNVRGNRRVQRICRKRWQKQIAVSKKQRIHSIQLSYADQGSSTINQDNSCIQESHIFDPQYLSQRPYKEASSPSKQYDSGAFNYLDLIKFQNNILASPPQKLEKSNEEFKESKMFSSIVPKEQQLGNKNQQHKNQRSEMEFINTLENKREIVQQQQNANIILYDNHQSSNNLQNNAHDAALQLMTQVKVKLKQSQKFQPYKRGNLPKPILQKVHIQPTAILGEAIQRQEESIWEEEPEIIKRNDKGKTIQNSLWH